jgi:predicted enzyme related to lactoylglutathione lyase
MSQHHTIDYVELPSTDFAAMKAFYGAVFGWKFVEYGGNYVAFTGAGLEGGFAPVENTPPRGGAMVILYSDDLAASEAAVRKAGAEIIAHHEFPGGSRFQFLDPTGNELAVWTKE